MPGELIVEMPRSGGTVIPRRRRGVGDRRQHVLAGGVLDRGVGEAVLQRVGLLDVADRALGLLDRRGDAGVLGGAGADRPLDVLVGADRRLPASG